MQKAYSGTESERATAALREISIAVRQPCMDRRSPEYRALLLDRVGAYLLRARASISGTTQGADVDINAHAVEDTEKAITFLDRFLNRYPVESSKEWQWIATTFQKAGRPWLALAFLSRLDSKCCKPEKMAEFRGELFFELGIYNAASKAYSEWLTGADPYSFCGSEVSLAHAASLRRRGFSVPDVATEQRGECVVLSDWEPYVRPTDHFADQSRRK